MYLELSVLVLFTFAYGLFSKRISRLPMSGPIVFVLAGIALGPSGLEWFHADVSRSQFQVLVDLTLALILFTDASNSNFNRSRKEALTPL